jgi:hypothetical protein
MLEESVSRGCSKSGRNNEPLLTDRAVGFFVLAVGGHCFFGV